MKMHYLEFRGKLRDAADALNANGLAVFDVVAMRGTRKGELGWVEVILRVPDAFEEVTWGAPDAHDPVYRLAMTDEAAAFRRGSNLPETTRSWEKIG